VYDEDAARGSKLLTAQPQLHRQTSPARSTRVGRAASTGPIIQISPGDIAGMQPFVDNANPQDRTTLFVGKLRSPHGNARLVFLDMRITLTGHRSGGKSSKDANASPSTKRGSIENSSTASTTPARPTAILANSASASR
jgi:hypothetical protein